jgi:hypothetical protein
MTLQEQHEQGIANKSITLPKHADFPAYSLFGNNTGSPATPIALTVAQVNAMGIGTGDISGVGVVGQLAEFVTDTKHIQAAKLIAPTGAILTLVNANAKSVTFPGSANDTVAMLAVANQTFTTQQIIKNTLSLQNSGNTDQADITFSEPLFGQLSYSVPAVNGKALIKFAQKASSSNGVVTFFIGESDGSSFSGANLLFGVKAGSVFITNATNGNTAGTLSLGGANWEGHQGILSLSGDVSAGTALSIISGCAGVGYAASAYKFLVYGETDIIQTLITSVPGQTADIFQICNRAGSTYYTKISAIGKLSQKTDTSVNNAVSETLQLMAKVSTAASGGVAGFGTGLSLWAETATDGTEQQQAYIQSSWIDATNATRKAKLSLSAFDTAERLGLTIEADGSATKLGLYGATPVLRATTAGAAATFAANTSGIADDTATFDGYTIGQIVKALRDIGALT